MSNHYIDHVSDDGAIFLRYAENIIQGKGAVFNQGEYVEGYSSPLWLLLLCIFSICICPYLWFLKYLRCILWEFYFTLQSIVRTNHLKFSSPFWDCAFIWWSFLLDGHRYGDSIAVFLWVGLAVFGTQR